ncbi:nicotinamide/nicotinic acid mononucleotide adenylyltransferase 3-like [Uranotaenia lowii]|uniref:nicotinamide/nicotinic acid mononucleotide adenylyltransferase 3-like n=1 Tax=Uranotaenia lowii TaxID=190385 RepID=UPI00247875B8|nr:nicotinamide/nicotinic acid mononucleotide adenylyltransferase 3-like [Uranotaenia lowii]
MRMTSSTKIMLIACGSFSPPTPMHFRMFEIAKDHFHQMGIGQVIGGIVSPVHDSYGKKGLVSATHRSTMIKIALQSSDWIRLSDWETQQEEWTRTRLTLQYHQNYINSLLKDSENINDQQVPSWIPEGLKKSANHVQLKLLCGADLLESFATPGLWKDEDIEAILSQHGLVVISRVGSNPEQFIFNSDLLSRYRRNITIVTNWVTNDVSSTLIRRLLSRNLSVKYLLDDFVTEYIRRHGLYGTCETKYILSTNNSTGEMMSISPVSPINDNDAYIESQNERNALNTLESMDETDFQRATLNRVFCCGTESNDQVPVKSTRSFLTHPGSAVQIITSTASSAPILPGSDKGTVVDDKVGDNKCTIATISGTANSQSAPQGFRTSQKKSTGRNAPTPDIDLVEHNVRKAPIKILPGTSDTVANQDSPGGTSPSKSYDDMIKFVFTEHGIRVISDREYVV